MKVTSLNLVCSFCFSNFNNFEILTSFMSCDLSLFNSMIVLTIIFMSEKRCNFDTREKYILFNFELNICYDF